MKLILFIFLIIFILIGCGYSGIQNEIIQFFDEIYYIEEEMMSGVDALNDIEEQIKIIENAYEELYTIYVPEPCEKIYSIEMERYQCSLDMWYEMYKLLYINGVSEDEFLNNNRINELLDKSAQLDIDLVIEQNKIIRDYNIEIR